MTGLKAEVEEKLQLIKMFSFFSFHLQGKSAGFKSVCKQIIVSLETKRGVTKHVKSKASRRFYRRGCIVEHV